MEIPAKTVAPEELAHDETYWSAVASHFDITDEVNHLENGYWGAMGRETLASYQRHTAEVNRGNAWWPNCWAWGPTRSRSPAAPPRRCWP
ncbi:hypothetical protein G6F54_013982 [Rhizopus delemar]|nr:hypothetical protein G6F54_013982 [Rhizopus delemar]